MAVSLRPRWTSLCGAQLERAVGGGEGGDVVLIGLVGDSFVLGAVAEAHEEDLGGIADDSGGGGGGDARGCGVGDVGHEDLVPVGGAGAGADILDIEDEVLEVLVEDAGLDLVGGLRGVQCLLHVENGLIGAGGEIERVGEAEQGSADGDDGGDAHKVADAQAGGAHGDDFAVGGEAAEAKQDADQYRHGNGDREEVGQREEEDLRCV